MSRKATKVSRKPSAAKKAAANVKGALKGAVVAFTRRLPGSGMDAITLLENGTFVNAVLVREGLARVTGQAGPRADELRRAEAEAKAARRGLWRAATPQLHNAATPR